MARREAEPGVVRLALGPLPPAGVQVRLEKVSWTDASFQILAFLNLPDSRLATAGVDDPFFADALYMYGGGGYGGMEGTRSPEQRLSGKLVVRPELVASRGRPTDNELVILVRDLEGEPASATLEVADFRLESLP